MQNATRISATFLYLSVAGLLGGCDATEAILHRIFNDPLKVVRVTTTGGQTVDLINPYVDYLGALGVGSYHSSAFFEGRGLRTSEGVLQWSEFKSLTIRRTAKPARIELAEGDSRHPAEVTLIDGATVKRELRNTPVRGLLGWQKPGDLPVASGQAWVEVPMQVVARIEMLDPIWMRDWGRSFKSFNAKATRTGGGACEGEARVNRPIPTQMNVGTAQNDSDLGIWVEDGDVLRQLDMKDIREIAVGERKDNKQFAKVTFQGGTARFYSVRDAYFEWQSGGPNCQQVKLYDIQLLQVASIAK